MSDSHSSLPAREVEILAMWEKQQVFKKTLDKPSPKGNFVFFEGPPTANGKPGLHHAEARAFKDIIPRFRTMQGYHVERKGGWDTHGLPVELEVEKQLGFTNKNQIEAYGIEAFNKQCKESVWKYLDVWQTFTKRMGYWVDMEHPYVTYQPEYVESLWWVIKQMSLKNLLYRDYRVTPHCPRCGTSLSSHELAQGYKEVEDPAVYVKFRVTKQADGSVPTEPEYLVAWTTTPWTLPSNVALAVGSDVMYVLMRYRGDKLWLAKARVNDLVKEEFEILQEKTGKELVGMSYEPLYPFVLDVLQKRGEDPQKGWQVVPASFVSTEDGSGIVHTAVMYGADDFELGKQVGLPKVHLVGLDGKFLAEAGQFAGVFVKSADKSVMADLVERGLMLEQGTVKHTYPFCWRCKTPVLYYAKDSWYVRVSSLRDKLLAENEQIHWEPEHLKEGRFGEWLREIKDWAFSRERYWGTPLPVWVCSACKTNQVIGSFEELRGLATAPLPEPFDPHRPFVDNIKLKCVCGGEASRVPDVCDVWFDSGAMPYAQWHYPFENKAKIDAGEAFPADYISEAIDQTRGWFYTLLAVSTALGLPRPYKNVVCLGHVLDAKGKKMSKSLGNIVEPMEMMEKYGADAVRWYMYTINQPGESKRFDEKTLQEMVRNVFAMLGNIASFYETYAGAESTGDAVVSEVPSSVLDKWILARLEQLSRETTEHLEAYRVLEPAREIANFINDFSTWWLRRSRDRFKGKDVADRASAQMTMKTCLLTLSKLLAPFAPFFAEDLYRRVGGRLESVHLEEWPVLPQAWQNESVLTSMVQVRSLVSKGLENRVQIGRNIRQALASATVTSPRVSPTNAALFTSEFVALIADELNVKEVRFVQGSEETVVLDPVLTPALLKEGLIRELIRRVNGMRKDANLTIQDRIRCVVVTSSALVNEALQEHREPFMTGVLATELVTEGQTPANAVTCSIQEQELTVGFEKI